MNGTRTVILLIIVFVVALFLGFLIGSKRVSDVRRELTEVKTEFEAAESTLRGERNKAIAQKELAVCRYELVQCGMNASRRDFGKATENLAAGMEAFNRATSVAPSDFAEKLNALKGFFAEVQAGLDKNDVKVVGRLTELANEMQALIAQ